MAKLTVEEAKEFTIFPQDTLLRLKVDELTEREVDGRNGTWTKLEFKFKVLEVVATGDGSPASDYEEAIGSPIWGSVPLRLSESPENKLRLWAEAILQIEMGVGFELDTDVFIGREVRGITTIYEKRAVNPRTGQKLKGHQIDSLLPVGGGVQQQPMQAAAPQPQQAQDPWATPAQQAPVQAPAQPAFSGWDSNEDPPF